MRLKFIDCVYVGLLILYALAGMMAAPFHGDEATTMYVARDWYTIFQQHDLADILYNPKLTDQRLIDAQEFRIRMGASARYAIGFLTNAVGMNSNDLTDPWFWGADYNDNVAHGHVAKPPVLFVARLSSALMLILSIAVVFAVGKRLGGRSVAYVGTFVYALTPSLLLNGRRAMYEGSTALFITSMLLVGLVMSRAIRLKQPQRKVLILWLVFGVIAGVAVAGKTSMALIALPIGAVLVVLSWRNLPRTIGYSIASGVVALAAFLLLNPAWWSQPLQMPSIMAKLNLQTTQAQEQFYGAWTNVPDRLIALERYPFSEPQYFEDSANWRAWIGDEINAYESSGLMGFVWGRMGIVLYALMAIGIVALLLNRRAENLFFIGALLGIMLAVFVATPLPWQRYYLLLVAPWAVTIGMGVNLCWQFATHRLHSPRIATLQTT
jgi:4-amino-4-deoxy-L-arabinose transferase-like glycosyltransferase